MHLTDLKDTYSGRIFILGTGPSLCEVPDWAGITPTFGCNKLGYWNRAPLTDFYACNYNKVIRGEVPNPNPAIHKFLVGTEDHLAEKGDLEWSDWVWVTKGADSELETGAMVGNTFGAMTLICAQIAYVLGFREMYLLGCDQTTEGSIFDPKDDRLFDQPAGTVFKDPSPWWAYFRDYLESNGGHIYDCSGGTLTESSWGSPSVLPYAALDEVLCQSPMT